MIERILVALDASVRAPAVFRRGAELGLVCAAELILFRAVAVPPEFPAAGAGAPLPRHGSDSRDHCRPRRARRKRDVLIVYRGDEHVTRR